MACHLHQNIENDCVLTSFVAKLHLAGFWEVRSRSGGQEQNETLNLSILPQILTKMSKRWLGRMTLHEYELLPISLDLSKSSPQRCLYEHVYTSRFSPLLSELSVRAACQPRSCSLSRIKGIPMIQTAPNRPKATSKPLTSKCSRY